LMDRKKTVILASEEEAGVRWTEEMSVIARAQKDFERGSSRFDKNELIAEIQWKSGSPRTASGIMLRPLNAIELRAFGCKCIELAAEMEAEQRSRG
jgi:hypothetical protein